MRRNSGSVNDIPRILPSTGTVMNELLEHLRLLRTTERRGVMATLIGTSGPSPRRVGAKMWVGESGRSLGSVSVGGCIDTRVAEIAPTVIHENKPRVLRIDMSDASLDLGFTCAGMLDVLIEPVEFSNPDDPIVAGYETIRAVTETGGRSAILTQLDGDFDREVLTDDDQRVNALFERGASQTISEAGATAFAELHQPATTLAILGAGPVAPPLIELAGALGMRTLVVDPRAKIANAITADEVRVGDAATAAAELSGNTAVVLLAHDYKYDLPILRSLLRGNVPYIGLLGSRRRGKALLEFLESEGFSSEKLARIRVPVGLDIGAESPKELALSILAEVMAVLRGKRGGSLAGSR
jgi:xanthine dehydrogenase accessory factor